MKKLTLLLAAIFMLSAASAQSQKLEYKLKKGETYRQSVTTESLVKQNMMGQTIEVSVLNTVGTTTTVLEETPAGYKLSSSITSMSVNTNVPGMSAVSYSTEDDANTTPNAKEVSAVLKSIKNKPFTMEMTKRGEVTNVTGIDAMLKDQVAAQNLGEAEKNQLRQTMSQTMSDESYLTQMKQATMVYPEKALKVGDTWSQNSEIRTNMTLNLETKYTVRSLSKTAAVIDMSALIHVKDQGMEVNGIAAIVNMEGAQTGTITINPVTGWVISSVVKQEIKGQIEVQGMSIPMETITTVTVTDK